MRHLAYSETPSVHLPGTEIDVDFNRRLEEVKEDRLYKEVPEFQRYVAHWVDRKQVCLKRYNNS